jgi:hypothetical protein
MQQTSHFSKIYVVESLPPGDRRTGKLLWEDIDSANALHQRDLQTEFQHPRTRADFLACLARVQADAARGEYPILHIECHGSRDKDGLILADESYLSWAELKPFLTSINVAARCNLLIVMAACYGGYLGHVIVPTDRAPCWGFIGPTESVYPDELLSGFNAFYGALLASLDGDQSLAALSAKPLRFGGYYFTSALHFFKRAYAGYLKQFGSDAALDERARRVSRQLRRMGSENRPGKGALKRLLKRTEGQSFEKYHRQFFMLDLFPENEARFALSLADVNELKTTLTSRSTRSRAKTRAPD